MSEHVRQLVIDPSASFLVQAPAGSGKTELLTQRILNLLACVDTPEEILALTFTRKAAAEMRNRVLAALKLGQPEAAEKHRFLTWQLAQKALARDAAQGWNLQQNPNRLRIVTLDSLSSALARQLPLLSGLGRMPETQDYIQPLYRQAAERALQQGQRQYPKAVATLLLHQDHNTAAVIRMMAGMLENREQWLAPVIAHARDIQGLRQHLESNLAAYISHHLLQCDLRLPVEVKASLPPLLRFAAEHGGDSQLAELSAWPEADVAHMQAWQAICRAVLTSSGDIRKTVNKNNGFPADAKVEKQAIIGLLGMLSDDQSLLELLQGIGEMPDSPLFDESQWQVLEALFYLLPTAAFSLHQIFQQSGKSDFTEIAIRAIDALSDAEERPTDLLLRLDYRIRHILVDEFQDTSELQIRLLQCLTSGWQPDDADRTLFMVGDPMQSIYRFRKAEVGLFLKTKANLSGLPHVQAQTLERNFRSDPAVIDWVNQAFRNMFPRHEDMLEGAIPYSQAKAMRTDGGSVHLHLQARRDDEAEASAVIAMVQQALQQGHSTGILARSRKHLHHIMDALQQANIPFRAIKILPLHEQPEIRALVALTRALLHPQDRVAWAGVLRSPCCGLSTQDLFSLPGDSETSPWQQLKQSQQMQLTTGHAQQARIAHVVQALDPCIGLAGKIAVRTLVKTAWQRLGMPGTLLPEQQTNVGNVLDLLDQLDGQPVHGEIDFALLDEHLAKRFTEPDSSPQANMVELLTMHGAKGLEWDTVILPGLGKDPGNSASPLLAFTEASAQTQSLFLMSPKSQTRSNDTLYNFIRRIEKARDTHETRRLLYVACTRARKTLHLCGHLNKAEEAARSSLLHLLLSQDETAFGATLHNIEATAASATNIRPLTRMAELPACLEATTAPASTASEIEYIWSGPTATAVGHAVHACLQQIGEQGIEQWQSSDSDAAINHMHRSLMREGLSGTLLEQAMQRCTRAINNTLSSSHGQWILSGQHQHARCEWPLSKRQHQQIRHFILDRSFIDEHGTRWIIDYKVSDHEGGNLESFIASEADRYSPQIRAYGALLGDLEPGRDIKQAIYFPLMDYLYVYPALG